MVLVLLVLVQGAYDNLQRVARAANSTEWGISLAELIVVSAGIPLASGDGTEGQRTE